MYFHLLVSYKLHNNVFVFQRRIFMYYSISKAVSGEFVEIRDGS